MTIEEPLEIRLAAPGLDEFPLAITMRTPGNDNELALGFLYTEGIIRSRDELVTVEHCRPPAGDEGIHNSIRVVLGVGDAFDPALLERHFYTTSSCGVCGKTSIEAVMNNSDIKVPQSLMLTAEQVQQLPVLLRDQQSEFSATGGIHASGLIGPTGNLLRVREDVGRHNAMDKLIGSLLLDNDLPLGANGVVLSGRASFELVQKAAVAGAQIIVAIGPPSSLAVALAEQTGITLAGFVRNNQFNLYSHAHRLAPA
ncbi:MAG TPA: formate dehydrogenase accessory sulfurtransferase FdhD [Pseudomonadales bacterium]|nr:formate dehydrogenase accessory sulfurtransferase FdhD [Pseudomonadales bacterium]